MSLPSEYSFVDAPPTLETYLAFCQLPGALDQGWAFSTIIYNPTSEVVALVRAIGDGGWYFGIEDLAVLPAHRGKGLAESLIRRIVHKIQTTAPPNMLIVLNAGKAGQGQLFARCGFEESAPLSIAMTLGRDVVVESSKSPLPAGYRLIDTPPALEDYRELRRLSGLSAKSAEQAAGALADSWAFVRVVHAPTGQTVAMVRALGDGGSFIISDMGALPEHRRRGLGDAVLRELLRKIQQEAPPGAPISLSADEMGRSLYRKCGFIEEGVGMWLLSGPP